MDKNVQKKDSKGTLHFGVKFRKFDLVYSIQNLNVPVKLYDDVVVETNRGKEFGVIALIKKAPNQKRRRREIVVKKIVRIASKEDKIVMDSLDDDENQVFQLCVNKNKTYQLPIRFLKVEKLFDGSRYVIYYKKQECNKKKIKKKINFQPLLDELRVFLGTKVVLNEVGSRGEAKIFCGMGHCGKNLCCVSWNSKGSAVSVKMAKSQGMPINIRKLTGSCGRLICCLSYEKDNYQDGELIRD